MNITGTTRICQCGEKLSVGFHGTAKLTKERVMDAVIDAHREHLGGLK